MKEYFSSLKLLINILSIVSIFSVKYKILNACTFSKNIPSQSQLQMCTPNSVDEINLGAPVTYAKDLYKDLSVPQNSNTADLKQAYMKIACSSHFDTNNSNESLELFQNTTYAYNTLGIDEKNRVMYDQQYEAKETMNFIEEIGTFVIGKASEAGRDVFKTYFPMISSSIQSTVKSLNIPGFQSISKPLVKQNEIGLKFLDIIITNATNRIPKTIGTELDTFLEEIGIDKDFYEKYVPAINSTIHTVKAIATEISKHNKVEDCTDVSNTLDFDENINAKDTHLNIENKEEVLTSIIDSGLFESNEMNHAADESLENTTDVYDNAYYSNNTFQIHSLENENENNLNLHSIESSLEHITKNENNSLISLNNQFVSAVGSCNNITKTDFKTLYTNVKKSRKTKTNSMIQSSSTNCLQNDNSIKKFTTANIINLFIQKIIDILRLSRETSNSNTTNSNNNIKFPYHLTVIMFLTIRPLKIYNFFRSFRIQVFISLLTVLGWNIYNIKEQFKVEKLS